MAILKKGSRCIVIEGRSYRWRVPHRPSYSQGLCWSDNVLAVESAESPGSKLIVFLASPHAGNWLEQPFSSVLPSQVAQCIQEAIKLGWQPTKPGKPFLLDLSPSKEGKKI